MDDIEFNAWRAEIDLCEDFDKLTNIIVSLLASKRRLRAKTNDPNSGKRHDDLMDQVYVKRADAPLSA